jgi:hypothetical protein
MSAVYTFVIAVWVYREAEGRAARAARLGEHERDDPSSPLRCCSRS